ncbi:outer membrane beta-barrel protein [Leptobacterium flavescens]|uniref:Outer membrane beta-barrel protein n=1 Tax=Leptobacterium flavescens TaxID=472055 RepID=A0A6P0URJ7_9FLAO|nr:porin family protein [Leptobacterium flavescens]NER15557.1 outer membrane beta-barrel protein [Leptobacterium flavescens]
MRKFLLVLCILGSTLMYAQSKNAIGIKGGLNYSSNGDLFTEAVNAGQDIIEGSESKVGYHIGFYGKIHLSNFYLRPELVYTKTTSQYEDVDYDIKKLDLPVLLGYRIIGPLSIFAGPSFQYILDNDLDIEDIDLGDVENEISLGLNIGAAVQLGNIGLDVRYERGFSENEAAFIGRNISDGLAGRVDSRPSQIIFSLSVKL